MKDQHTIDAVSKLHPKFIPLATGFINDAEAGLNLILRVVQGFRTFAEQDAIYAQGRTKPGKVVTWSPSGTSYHNYGLAIDVAPLINNGTALDWNYDFSKLTPYSSKYGLTWGGNFPKGQKDLDHFENKFGLNWRDLLHKYQIKDFIPGTVFPNI